MPSLRLSSALSFFELGWHRFHKFPYHFQSVCVEAEAYKILTQLVVCAHGWAHFLLLVFFHGNEIVIKPRRLVLVFHQKLEAIVFHSTSCWMLQNATAMSEQVYLSEKYIKRAWSKWVHTITTADSSVSIRTLAVRYSVKGQCSVYCFATQTWAPAHFLLILLTVLC